MTWEELLDITPGMFLSLQREHDRQAEERRMNFRFLATVISKSIAGAVGGGEGTNFMEDTPAASKPVDKLAPGMEIDEMGEWMACLPRAPGSKEPHCAPKDVANG